MPKLDRDEAHKEVCALMDNISPRPMTIFKKEARNLNIGALNQMVEFLRDVEINLASNKGFPED